MTRWITMERILWCLIAGGLLVAACWGPPVHGASVPLLYEYEEFCMYVTDSGYPVVVGRGPKGCQQSPGVRLHWMPTAQVPDAVPVIPPEFSDTRTSGWPPHSGWTWDGKSYDAQGRPLYRAPK